MSLFKSAVKRGCSVFLLICTVGLAACDSGGGGADEEDRDTAGPSMKVFFPPRYSITNGDTVTIYGTASDESDVDSVEVDGTPADTSDDFANWQITLTLSNGTNEIDINASDSKDNRTTTTLTIRKNVLLASPERLAIDSANDRALVTDDAQRAVIAIDLSTGERNVLSGPNIPDGLNPFAFPFEIAVDSANSRALVLDVDAEAVIAVNLANGARTVLSSNTVPNATNPFSNPNDIVVDAANNSALVVNGFGTHAVLKVDLTTGARTVLTDATTPDSDDPLGNPFAIALDGAHNRALVMEAFKVTAVDLTTGERAILSDSFADPNYAWSGDVAADLDHNRLLSVHMQDRTVLAESMADGTRSVFANLPSSLTSASGIAIDSLRNRALVVDFDIGAIASVGLGTGQSSVLWSSSTPNTSHAFKFPTGIVVDSAHGRALVSDQDRDAIVAVNLRTGERSILSDDTRPNATNEFEEPTWMALDTAHNRVLVTDSVLDAVVAVNLNTGARKIMSGAGVPDGTNVFDDPVGIVIDSTNNRALVVDRVLNAIIAVNLNTGARTILSDDDEAGDPFVTPVGIALDSANNRALVTEAFLPVGVIAVDLTTGARTPLSTGTVPNADTPFDSPAGIMVDAANNRALVTDIDLDAIVAVDLASGARTILSGPVTPDVSNPLADPLGIVLDSRNHRLLAVDASLEAVVAVQPANGDRVIFSK
ncbi:MAG TPA: hypothetical protein VFX02_13705 [Gammaproteobacteria bacterium]|nr:hypothetical protein [Gammaproteobacteria bacterium]